MTKTALITGITGQDGSYLAELLLRKGYRVAGMVRGVSTPNLYRLRTIKDQIELVSGDLLDQNSLFSIIKSVQPDEVYNLAAQSFVPSSWNQPVLTGDLTALGVTRILEAVRFMKPDAKFFQASSSEIFGNARETPQSENTPIRPCSPLGIAKAYGHWITVNYRESYNMFACNGILFNHESPRRGLDFVARKITYGVARIKSGFQKKLHLGNIDTKRDWGYAPDYMEATWQIMAHDNPEDFVIATGEAHTVREIVQTAFELIGLIPEDHVVVDHRFFRPTEVGVLLGDNSKAQKILGWKPKTTFKQLVALLLESDLKKVKENPEESSLFSE
ncbi:GDP-mannose 4,6-dehydratase [bacterium]|nr:GDP-mannose 4,6-dehydratase [bacterium]